MARAATVLILGLLLFDGVVMLLSPRRWFQLPSYIGLHGSMRREMLSTFAGRLNIRLMGLVAIAVAGYFGASSLWGDGSVRKAVSGRSLGAPYHFLPLALGMFAGLGVAAIGLSWLVRPRWCLNRCWRPREPEIRAVPEGPLIRIIRMTGAVTFLIGAYVTYSVTEAFWH